jgi:hypothetical protein
MGTETFSKRVSFMIVTEVKVTMGRDRVNPFCRNYRREKTRPGERQLRGDRESRKEKEEEVAPLLGRRFSSGPWPQNPSASLCTWVLPFVAA